LESVIFTDDLPKTFTEVLQSLFYSRMVILIDSNTKTHCLPLLQNQLPKNVIQIEISPGEEYKTLDTCSLIWKKMTEETLDRKSLLINLGGGVIGDMGGFCASIYKRGIPFISIPTTLLAQVDASVGGKVGIDFLGFKNQLGAFNPPECVIIAPQLLRSLPQRELRSGYAEVLKHGLIRDAAYFRSLKTHNWETQDWDELIPPSVSIKKAVVEVDPKELGLRKILNFGHSIGHAVESFFLESASPLLHGEAIALGMIAEAFLSFEKIGFSYEEFTEVSEKLLRIFGKIDLSEAAIDSISILCNQDKKNEDNTLLFSLLPKIGDCTYNVPVSTEEIKRALQYYHNLPFA